MAAKATLPKMRLSTGRPVIFASMDLRDRPTTSGTPSTSNAARFLSSARLWAAVLPKPKPGSMLSRAESTPASRQARMRAARNVPTSSTTLS